MILISLVQAAPVGPVETSPAPPAPQALFGSHVKKIRYEEQATLNGIILKSATTWLIFFSPSKLKYLSVLSERRQTFSTSGLK